MNWTIIAVVVVGVFYCTLAIAVIWGLYRYTKDLKADHKRRREIFEKGTHEEQAAYVLAKMLRGR